MRSLSDFIPHFVYYMFWERKEKFLLYEDLYKDWTIFAVESGSFYFEIGNKKGTATLGDLVFCPPGVRFTRVVISPLTFHNIRVRWEDGQGTEFAPHDLSTNFPVGKVYIKHTSQLIENYTRMKRVKQLGELTWKHRLNHCLQDIWYLYCDECGLTGEAPRTESWERDDLMTLAANQLSELAFEEFNLKELAASLGLTPSQLSIRFKTAFGEPPIQYLTSLRINKAKTLLLETKMNMDQISECCGYQNGYYFNRTFTKQMGITPGKFRRIHQV